MAELIQLNRDPKINEFSKEDLVLNTVTGDLFAKTDTKLFRIFVGNATQNIQGTDSQGNNIVDGFYGVISTGGDDVSLHGGNTFINAAYIKTPGSFEILLDSANGSTSETFKIHTNTGLGGIAPGKELLSLDENGNLTISGSLDGGSF